MIAPNPGLGEAPARIGVVRALAGLGDMLCTVPALRALRTAYPHAEISLIGLPWVGAFVDRFSMYLDELVEFPGYPGIAERPYDPARFRSFIEAMHERPFDAVIQMHGSGLVSNSFAALLSSRVMAGFYLPGQFLPDPARFLPYPAHEPEVRRHLALMTFLGIQSQGENLEFPITPHDEAGLYELSEAAELRGGAYACMHPGASLPERRWAMEGFAEVGDKLARQGLRVVITGSSEEREITRSISARMRAPAIDLAGRTKVGELAALVRDARVLVCNDTSVSHIAAALGVPSVVVFTHSDPDRWAPLMRVRHRPVGRPASEANRCLHDVPSFGHRCLRDGCTARMPLTFAGSVPTAEDVWAEAERLLAAEWADAR
ncbi:MAG: glycosyltransferase family 9 protein [Actinomycetota bacterium]|nr:glycosyltransferase family 9 protein [Actinomycetota bacterium]